MKDTHIMPFRFVVAHAKNFQSCQTEFFNEGGDRFYSLKQEECLPLYIDFNSDLYCEVISIQTADDAKAFLQTHESLRFLYYQTSDARNLGLHEYETLDRLCEIIASAINQYHKIHEFILIQKAYQQSLSEEDREKMVSIYSDLYSLLGKKTNSYKTYDQMVRFYYDLHDVVDEVVEGVYDLKEANSKYEDIPFDELYKELESQYFDGRNDLLEAHQEYLSHTVKSIVDSIMFKDVASYIDNILSSIKIVFDATEMSYICRCPDLISAIYMMIYVSLHNGDTYQICDHKKCRQYFLVNHSHPQKSCPLHMKSKQRKRQNQQKYQEEEHYTHNVT